VVAHTDRGTFEADRAVVAVPLGVLKAGTIDLDPQPAEAQRLAVERLAMGTLEKVVFRFDRRFWPEEVRGIVHVSEESAFPYWCDLSAHAGAPTLATLYNPLLTTRVAEQPAEHRAEAGLEVLSRMFPEVPDPEETLFTDWIGDPWARGSYSYIPIGATVEDMRALAEPVSERLVLAGEVTVAESYGTVHAAFRSGLRAAGQVLGRRPERISLGPVAPSWVARP
jgi:polyamine oxidase